MPVPATPSFSMRAARGSLLSKGDRGKLGVGGSAVKCYSALHPSGRGSCVTELKVKVLTLVFEALQDLLSLLKYL